MKPVDPDHILHDTFLTNQSLNCLFQRMMLEKRGMIWEQEEENKSYR